ncbi:uncharacterized protein BT62DRAFT_397918 [Guyanagaster necrorhizus]|uniref:Uncharacterized protein n=1 Tax=Guyanagaster necrorhizus TaxID=856835 RepID=A0A9P7W1Z0_9AGAR|nr:uncharacterized protein BT62DRAFT_397918 [Guyanagaster necrorhizus MCA 3950]KAG7451104.1 hypothetical protein BT62DRAFT_397918 [Guyanagaster necrorhizus MCA 3950]
MVEAIEKDDYVHTQCSSFVKKHLKRSSVDKTPRIKVDIRVRKDDIQNESDQQIIEVVGCRANDTLDIVLLSMRLDISSPQLRDNPHFYDRLLPQTLQGVESLAKRFLPFHSVLSDLDIPQGVNYLVLYCLPDTILLRAVTVRRSFGNIWNVNGSFILKGHEFYCLIYSTLTVVFQIPLEAITNRLRYSRISLLPMPKSSENPCDRIQGP